MTKASLLVVVFLAAILSGCAGGSSDGIKGLSPDDANRLNAGRSSFDTPTDPPFTAATRFAAGQLAESQGAPQAAIAQYSEAIKLDPKHQPSLYRLGVVCAQLKLYPQAIDAWKKYVDATNGSAAAYGNLGFCHELAGQTTEAEAAYLKGIERDPTSTSCRVNFGLMLARQGRVEDGLLQLQSVLTPAQAHYNIGSALEQMGKKIEARGEYEKAIELDPSMTDARVRIERLK